MKKYLILALLPFAACKKDKDKNEQALMPLTIGNQWVTQHITFDQNEVESDSYPNPPLQIVKKGTKDGYFSSEEDDSEQYFSSATEIRGYSPAPDEEEFRFLKSDKKETYNTVTDADGYKVESIAYPETSKVLGYDNCIRNEYITYDANGGVLGKDIYYVSPGIGIVRQEYYAADGNGGWRLRYRDDLQSYIIK